MEGQARKTRRPELAIRTPTGQQVVSLEQDHYELGRDESNVLSFPGVRGLSRKHLAFERNGSSWLVRDLGSTNGTFVNGNRINGSHALCANDRVIVGDLSIVFVDAPPSPPVGSETVVFVDRSVSKEAPILEATLDSVLNTDEEMQGSPHMRALVQAGRALCAQNSLDELFDVIMKLSIDAVGAPRGVLITMEDGEFRVRASLGERGGARGGAGFRISSHVRDLVVNERRSLLVSDALSDEALAARMSIVEDQVRGILAAPLQTEKQVIGLIYLDSPIHVKRFSKDDLNVLTVLANIAAIRIERARLAEIEQAEKLRARELEHAARIQCSMLPADSKPSSPKNSWFLLTASVTPSVYKRIPSPGAIRSLLVPYTWPSKIPSIGPLRCGNFLSVPPEENTNGRLWPAFANWRSPVRVSSTP